MYKHESYMRIGRQLLGCTSGETDILANLANVSAILMEYIKDVNWVGFYYVKGQQLILGPFQGRSACTRLMIGKGVCGTCVANDEVIVVPDVKKFKGHVACDARTKSELVAPIHGDGKVIMVLDLDSMVKERFDEVDKEMILDVASFVEELIEKGLGRE